MVDDYLIAASPDILWFWEEWTGSYQGSVYALGIDTVEKKLVAFRGYYGSCSGCGAWGEGGEPTCKQDIIGQSNVFDTIDELDKFLFKHRSSDDYDYWFGHYEPPLVADVQEAFNRIKEYVNEN